MEENKGIYLRVQALCDALYAGGTDCEDEIEFISDMVQSCAAYVQAVMETETFKFQANCYSGDRRREIAQEKDKRRTVCHNSMISYIDSTNRLCDRVGVPRLYTGSSNRRDYGDWAILLVSQIFSERS